MNNKKVNNAFFPRNRRGQELSTNAIIMIIIGIIVLVVLVLGFTIGWNKLLPFVSSNNVGTIKNTCSIACLQEDQYDFCTAPRTLRADDLPDGEKEGTCFLFATELTYDKYGIGDCTSVSCG